jgi:diguanylate cyclase (GGDEF)-like protein
MVINTISWLNIAFGLGILASAIILSETSKNLPDSIPGGKTWARGNILFFSGLLLLGLRSQIPEAIPVIIGNTLIVIGLFFHYRALTVVLETKPNLKLNYAIIGYVFAGLTFFYFAQNLYAARIIVFSSGSLAYALVFIQVVTQKGQKEISGPRRIMLVFYSLFLLIFTYRIIFASLNIQQSAVFFEENIFYLVSLIFSSIMVILLTFAFVLLANSKNFLKLHELAYLDGLTKTRTRRAIIDHGVASISLSNRIKIPFSVMLIDIDNLKRINDTFGHLEGDKILIQTSSLIQENLREEDAVGRFGGDEFLVILRHTNSKGAKHTAQRLMSLIDQSNLHREPGTAGIEASIGICQYPFDNQSLEDVISLADQALYQVKESGGGGYKIWGEE